MGRKEESKIHPEDLKPEIDKQEASHVLEQETNYSKVFKNNGTKEDENGPTTDESQEIEISEEWKIEPCHAYEEEYKDCKCLPSRFHQIFVHGEQLDCKQWKIDAQNCWKWQKSGDQVAYQQLIESINNRRMERLRPHFGNTVWKKRDKPPSDWNAPLPEWLQQKMSKSYITYKINEIESSTGSELISKAKSCCIM